MRKPSLLTASVVAALSCAFVVQSGLCAPEPDAPPTVADVAVRVSGMTPDDVKEIYGEPSYEAANEFGRLMIYRDIAAPEKGPEWQSKTTIRFGANGRVEKVFY